MIFTPNASHLDPFLTVKMEDAEIGALYQIVKTPVPIYEGDIVLIAGGLNARVAVSLSNPSRHWSGSMGDTRLRRLAEGTSFAITQE